MLLLIPLAWLAVLILFVALCRMSARGDAALALEAERQALGAGIGRDSRVPRATSLARRRACQGPLGSPQLASPER
jgi:hypothetical protein